MPKYVVVRFDRYEVINSEKVVVSANSVQEAYSKAFKEIFKDEPGYDEEDIPNGDELDVNENGNEAGVDFEEESWFISKL